ncbi:uncharacterized protein LOC119649306 [Hermetia illucens]|uniref:uncharacterized protein LOC119649306 n=1 Tax=Hermetia illucens TaxID=343691 RepID=UPI0018CC2B23|nr:uncharacterized protein LOC119649306 [Hermetia illucens]
MLRMIFVSTTLYEKSLGQSYMLNIFPNTLYDDVLIFQKVQEIQKFNSRGNSRSTPYRSSKKEYRSATVSALRIIKNRSSPYSIFVGEVMSEAVRQHNLLLGTHSR